MKFIDFFSGVGGFTRGLELAGHKCIGHCEFDKFAEASYRSMHNITEEQRANLETMTKRERQKEILRSEYLNGEWYARDVRAVNSTNIPRADCWTFGAPCQDFSIAGKRAGLNGTRSSLVQEIFRILEESEEENKPTWLIYENVKGMLSASRGLDFLSILFEMDRLGYDAEWQIINSRWYVPQNRERVYVIAHLRTRRARKIFPVPGNGGANSFKLIRGGGRAQHIGYAVDKSKNNPREIDIANCISAKGDRGISNRRAEGTAIAIPVLTPFRQEKRQNGRLCKENNEEMFTLTSQDEHGVAIDIKALSSSTRGQPFRRGYAATLDHNCNQAVIAEKAVWSEKYNCYLAIRKLTPKECFRLQGWSDDHFEKAEFVNSDSQLYKQAGNGVTVNVVKEIGERLWTKENL